jgi:hypothetical protein
MVLWDMTQCIFVDGCRMGGNQPSVTSILLSMYQITWRHVPVDSRPNVDTDHPENLNALITVLIV